MSRSRSRKPSHASSGSRNSLAEHSSSRISIRMSDVATLAASADPVAQRAAIDRALADLCEHHLSELSGPVGEAVRYSLNGVGKRMRGILFLNAFHAAGGRDDASALAA